MFSWSFVQIIAPQIKSSSDNIRGGLALQEFKVALLRDTVTFEHQRLVDFETHVCAIHKAVWQGDKLVHAELVTAPKIK